jgi:uncharacterized cupredoxin-like copper-binding protein
MSTAMTMDPTPGRRLMLGAVLALATQGASAHGSDPHAASAAAVRKEQKPWGIAGDRRAVQRTIVVRMTDAMRFEPDRLELRQGETVRFVVRNAGRAMHEFVIGTKAELDAHADLMAKFPDMAHDEPYMAHVPPGRTGEIVWTFNRAGDFWVACLIAGHYQSGMVGRVRVTAASPTAKTP